jgi:hypothetical protein
VASVGPCPVASFSSGTGTRTLLEILHFSPRISVFDNYIDSFEKKKLSFSTWSSGADDSNYPY